MDSLSYKTPSITKDQANREWLVIDAKGMILGRLASQIALILRGKHKPSFTPHSLCGDHVIVINADKVRLTGNKMLDKQYVRHTGYPGGQRFATPKLLMKKHPHRIIEFAVKGMLPKNRLGAQMYSSLHVYAGAEHPHQAQSPKEYTPTNL